MQWVVSGYALTFGLTRGTAGAVAFLASAGFAVLALVVAVRQRLADERP